MKASYVDNKEDSNILMPGVHSDLSLSYACEKSNHYFLDSTTRAHNLLSILLETPPPSLILKVSRTPVICEPIELPSFLLTKFARYDL